MVAGLRGVAELHDPGDAHGAPHASELAQAQAAPEVEEVQDAQGGADAAEAADAQGGAEVKEVEDAQAGSDAPEAPHTEGGAQVQEVKHSDRGAEPRFIMQQSSGGRAILALATEEREGTEIWHVPGLQVYSQKHRVKKT